MPNGSLLSFATTPTSLVYPENGPYAAYWTAPLQKTRSLSCLKVEYVQNISIQSFDRIIHDIGLPDRQITFF
jgi:hypothetical protein